MQTLVIATRELHGVVMVDLEHVVLAWCVRFVGPIISCTVKGAYGLTAFPRALQGASHEEFVVGTLAGCVGFRTVKRRPREDAADLVFYNSIRGTPGRLVPDDEPRESREPREQPLRIDVPPVHADLPPPTSTVAARRQGRQRASYDATTLFPDSEGAKKKNEMSFKVTSRWLTFL